MLKNVYALIITLNEDDKCLNLIQRTLFSQLETHNSKNQQRHLQIAYRTMNYVCS